MTDSTVGLQSCQIVEAFRTDEIQKAFHREIRYDEISTTPLSVASSTELLTVFIEYTSQWKPNYESDQ